MTDRRKTNDHCVHVAFFFRLEEIIPGPKRLSRPPNFRTVPFLPVVNPTLSQFDIYIHNRQDFTFLRKPFQPRCMIPRPLFRPKIHTSGSDQRKANRFHHLHSSCGEPEDQLQGRRGPRVELTPIISEDRLMEMVSEDVGLQVSSWLTSYATTELRAVSKGCRRIFKRNASPTTLSGVTLEALTPPLSKCTEAPTWNPLSPLRAWRLELRDVPRLIEFERLIRCEGYRELGSRLLRDRTFVLAIMATRGAALKYTTSYLKRDRGVVMTAVGSYGLALGYAHDSFFDDREVVFKAVSQCGSAIKFAPRFHRDLDVVFAAVRSSGLALFYAHGDLKRYKPLVLAAVENNGLALSYASPCLRRDPDVVLAAVRSNGKALEFADPVLTKDSTIVAAAISQCPEAIFYAHPRGGAS